MARKGHRTYSKKELAIIHAKGGQSSFSNKYPFDDHSKRNIQCQKCGSKFGDDMNWFEAHKKTHTNFNQLPHYAIQVNRTKR